MALVPLLKLALLSATVTGHVLPFPSSAESASCGEVKTVICYSNGTNKITVAARYRTLSFGSHTYYKNSNPKAEIGPVGLNLMSVTPASAVKTALNNFNVTATERQNETIFITCTDVYNTLEVEIKTFSKGCPDAEVRFDETKGRLEWDEPTCKGWESNVLSNYAVTVHYSTGMMKTYPDQKERSIIITKPFVKVSINMTNNCEETSTLATYNYQNAEHSNDGLSGIDMTKGEIVDGGGSVYINSVNWYYIFPLLIHFIF